MEALNAEAAKKKGGAKVPPKVDRDAIQGQFDDAFSALQTVL